MIVHPLNTTPPPHLALALERFEEQFTYPLGPGRSFRISHGEDYPRFFRAMGEAACFVVTREGNVLGVLGAVLRSLLLPGGEERQVVYLGDLKIHPLARQGWTLPRLAQAVMQWAEGRSQAAFGVVMDGTPTLPTRYTGRLGIPLFEELGRIMVLRLPTAADSAEPDKQWQASDADGTACFQGLSTGRYASVGGIPIERSATEPLWLQEPEGLACGRLEDTLRAKRLIANDGTEMRSAHLSCFAYQNLRAGVKLLGVARRLAADRGFPNLFVAVAAPEAEALCQALAGTEIVVAPATIFGCGLEPGPLWNINTAEI
jgi:hypothetical protein